MSKRERERERGGKSEGVYNQSKNDSEGNYIHGQGIHDKLWSDKERERGGR